MVLRALNVENDLQPMKPEPLPVRTWRQARTRTSRGRASTSCRGCCVASATSRPATSSPPRPDAGPYAARIETLLDGPQIFDAARRVQPARVRQAPPGARVVDRAVEHERHLDALGAGTTAVPTSRRPRRA